MINLHKPLRVALLVTNWYLHFPTKSDPMKKLVSIHLVMSLMACSETEEPLPLNSGGSPTGVPCDNQPTQQTGPLS